ncbi:hypothetical protein [Kitasatospora sp. NPDC059160]|uniref:hypothetical protein n=2 Tax=unclassified Kitasatospora TaxID=2633591 RepID=UPI00368208B4
MAHQYPASAAAIEAAAAHFRALEELFTAIVDDQGLAVIQRNGLRGYSDLKCVDGHIFTVIAMNLLLDGSRGYRTPGQPLCSECCYADEIASRRSALLALAEKQHVTLKPTGGQADESHDELFDAVCEAGHASTVHGRHQSVLRGSLLCRTCWEEEDYRKLLSRAADLCAETEARIIRSNFGEKADTVHVQCRRNHTVVIFSNYPSYGKTEFRPSFCGACNKLDLLAEFSDKAKGFGMTVLATEWKSANAAYPAMCFMGHEFALRPTGKRWSCPECPPGTYGHANPAHDVYYVVSGRDLVTDAYTVKPGISSGTGYRRLEQHKEDGLTAQHLRMIGLPAGAARELEQHVLAGLDGEGWISIRGVEYFPVDAREMVMDLAGGWFADQPGLGARDVIVDVDEILDAGPEAADVLDLDAGAAVVSDIEEVGPNALDAVTPEQSVPVDDGAAALAKRAAYLAKLEKLNARFSARGTA